MGASGTFAVAGNTFKSVLGNECSMRLFGRDAKQVPVAAVKPDYESVPPKSVAKKSGKAVIGAQVPQEISDPVGPKGRRRRVLHTRFPFL